MKPIRFTNHARQKLLLTQRQGFSVDEETIIRVIQEAKEIHLGYSGRLIAQDSLDDEHVLRVIYEESDVITVVTMYPGRRERYES